MRILERAVYLGPSLYASFPVIRLTVDLGPLEEWPTGRLGGDFVQALLGALPGLHEHGCSYGEPGGFVRRLREEEGTWMGHVLEHCAIEIQNMAGVEVTFGKTRGAGARGVYHVVYEYEEAEVGLEAGRLAIHLLHSLVPAELRPEAAIPEGFTWEGFRDRLIRFTQRRALGPSTAALVRAAKEREIPFIRLNRYSLVQFGHGKYQKRIQATVTSETRHIAVEIASDKEETNRILADLGLPVARQDLAHDEDDAVAAAERIGYPVVVKPLNANHGRGVSIRLTGEDQVRTAFHHAREHARTIVVESFIQGFDHRMLVVNDELVAVSQRLPGHVTGDGKQSVEDLVEEVNKDPRRGIGHEKVLTRIEMDHQAERLLAQKGYDRSTVPGKGEMVFLRSTGNLSTGGTAIDKTDAVHPDNRQMAVRAAMALGLDVAGVDFLTTDITRSFRETGGAICEVNAAPGFRMHVAPSEGTPRDVAGPVMDMLFPPGSPSRIPVASITGTNGKTTTARMLAHIHKMSGSRVGLATTDGVYIDGHRTVEGDMTGPIAARMVLRDPLVDVAVLETARGGMLKRGMGYKRCNVSAVLNVQADHLGLRGVNTLEELARVKRIVAEIARDTAVLNADDALCLKMAAHTRARHICYVTANPGHELVREHIRSGGRAAVLEKGINGDMITLYDHGAHMPLLWTHQIPATLDGRAAHNVQNAMFAASMAYAMDVKLEGIRHGLQTFDTSFFQAPGRMNIHTDHPFKVILDYGHNPAAVDAMCQLVRKLDVKRRRIVVLAAPGDRRDEDVREIARLAAGIFDVYICRRDDNTRGRASDEIPIMLRDGLVESGVDPSAIKVVPEEELAVDTALRMARRDDLVLIFGDDLNRTWKQITGVLPGETGPATTETITGAAPDPAGAEPSAVKMGRPGAPAHLREKVESSEMVEIEDGGPWIRDERGVLLPRESED